MFELFGKQLAILLKSKIYEKPYYINVFNQSPRS